MICIRLVGFLWKSAFSFFLSSPILVWMQILLKHRLMLRNKDLLFQENREKLLHALASVASQARLLCSKLTSYLFQRKS